MLSFARRIYLQTVSKSLTRLQSVPVFRIRFILMRIRIRGSASGIMDPDPGPVLDPDPTLNHTQQTWGVA